jgi:hypothetical protein
VNYSKTRLAGIGLIVVAMIASTTFGLLFSSLPLSVAAENAPGTQCIKAGTTAKSGGISVKCMKIGNKLIWQKAVAIDTNIPKYVVGDTGPGGGTIFYVAPTSFACGPTLSSTCNYLEAAPTTGTKACCVFKERWTINADETVGGTSKVIGTGYKNSLAMLQKKSTYVLSSAVKVARAYRGPKGKTDWFLPSFDELYQHYLQKKIVGSLNCIAYWSSSEDTSNTAFAMFDYDGKATNFYKNQTHCVWPVRAF